VTDRGEITIYRILPILAVLAWVGCGSGLLRGIHGAPWALLAWMVGRGFAHFSVNVMEPVLGASAAVPLKWATTLC
jgi:hypothetical protein